MAIDYSVRGEIETRVSRYHITQNGTSTFYSYHVKTEWTMPEPRRISWKTAVEPLNEIFDFDTYAPLIGEGQSWSDARKAHDAVLMLVMG